MAEQRFLALKDFEDTIGGRPVGYRAGMQYTARDGEKWAELRAKMIGWTRDKKIEIVTGPNRAAVKQARQDMQTRRRQASIMNRRRASMKRAQARG